MSRENKLLPQINHVERAIGKLLQDGIPQDIPPDMSHMIVGDFIIHDQASYTTLYAVQGPSSPESTQMQCLVSSYPIPAGGLYPGEHVVLHHYENELYLQDLYNQTVHIPDQKNMTFVSLPDPKLKQLRDELFLAKRESDIQLRNIGIVLSTGSAVFLAGMYGLNNMMDLHTSTESYLFVAGVSAFAGNRFYQRWKRNYTYIEDVLQQQFHTEYRKYLQEIIKI